MPTPPPPPPPPPAARPPLAALTAAARATRALLVVAATCAAARAAPGELPPAVAPPAAALASITGEALARHVEVLASDAFEGRFPGTAGETRTTAYLAAAFARAGLEAPYDGSYLQPVPLASLQVQTGSTLTARAADGAGELSLAFPEEVLLGGPAAGGHDRLADSPLVFVGHGITAPEHGWDDYAAVDVRGRTVLVLQGQPDRVPVGSHHGTTTARLQRAAEQGAAGFLLVLAGGPDALPWEVYVDHARQPAHRLAGEPTPAGSLLRGTLREDRAAALLALADLGLDELRAAAARPGGSRALPLAVDLDVHAVARPVMTHNVVGLLRGAERPDECVVYTAHWDHVGSREPHEVEGDDTIFNGAVDNATGTAALLELAAAFAALPERPARSVVFLATTAEEQGLLGAHWHAEHPLFPLGRIAAVLNMDAFFPFGATKGLTVVGAGRSELDHWLDAAARAVGRRTYPDPAPEQGAFFRSDHYPFASRGVPAAFAVGGPAQDPAAGETVDVQRWIDYGAHHYHRPSDEYDPATWDMAGIVQDVRGCFHAGWNLAQTEHFPAWSVGSEFAALRAAQRSR